MEEVQKLEPRSRPDREYQWTRFTHPFGGSYRVDLGTDPQRAREICADLTHILNHPQTWMDDQHPDLDGLHESAIEAFFKPIFRVMPEKLAELRAKNLEQRFEFVRLWLHRLGIAIQAVWAFSKGREDAVYRGFVDEHYRAYDNDILEWGKEDFPEHYEQTPEVPTPYLCVPGSTVFHKNFCWVSKDKAGCREFESKEDAENAGLRPCKICEP